MYLIIDIAPYFLSEFFSIICFKVSSMYFLCLFTCSFLNILSFWIFFRAGGWGEGQ